MRHRFNCKCSTKRLKEIRRFVTEVLKDYNLPELSINELVLAVDEVCANLMIHSHNCNPKESFELSINIDDDSTIIFEIVDHGIGFNVEKYKEPSLSDLIKRKKKGGMGLILVKRIMDKIECKVGPNKNIYLMHKKIENKPTDQN